MPYSLTLDGDSGSIKIDSEKAITNVEFSIASVDPNVKNRSNNQCCILVIKGVITQGSAVEDVSTKVQTLNLLKWSKSNEQGDLYKTVTLTYSIGEGKDNVRTIKIPNMFCVSYTETFDGSDNAEFILTMRQGDGLLKKIEVSC